MSTTPRCTDLEFLERAAECLRQLAHPQRLRMVQLLLLGSPTVTELAKDCGLPTAMASEHLRLLQRSGLLISKRTGRRVYYQVAQPHLKQILRCLEDLFDSAELNSASPSSFFDNTGRQIPRNLAVEKLPCLSRPSSCHSHSNISASPAGSDVVRDGDPVGEKREVHIDDGPGLAVARSDQELTFAVSVEP